MDAAERQALRDWLSKRGASPDQLARAETEGQLGRLASELVLTTDARLSARDLAKRAEAEPEDVAELFAAFGVAVPDLDASQFTEADARLCTALCRPEGHGMDLGPLPHVIAASMDRIAEAAVALYVQGPQADILRSGADAVELAEKTATATAAALDLGAGLGVLFRHHMRQAITRQRQATEGIRRPELARLAIGFVDLVGSTSIEAALDVGELADMVSWFEARAFEVVAAGGGRLVKFIGDEIMVAAVDPLAGCRIIAALVETFTVDALRPRAGLVYGEVLYRHGDYYGPVVNLAARLVDEAIPEEVLVDGSVVEAVGGGSPEAADSGLERGPDAPAFEPAGRRLLKGFAEPVAVWSLRRGS
ncbi:MAG TPA: adenylate cyclase regulatory domain-containing protein [Acidimicrobiales bacterium]